MGKPLGSPKTGGRQKGTPNKSTAEVQAKLESVNCDPILGMAKIAMDELERTDLRARMFAELAQYVAPKRKAIEHSGNIDGEQKWVAVDPEKLLAEAAKRDQLMKDYNGRTEGTEAQGDVGSGHGDDSGLKAQEVSVGSSDVVGESD